MLASGIFDVKASIVVSSGTNKTSRSLELKKSTLIAGLPDKKIKFEKIR